LTTSVVWGLVCGALVVGWASSGWAQQVVGGGGMSVGAAQKPEGTGGVMVGEGVYLRVGVTAEAGYDTNVFYNDADRADSATLHITPSLELTNSAREGTVKPPVLFSLAASLLYREYLSDDTQIRAQRAFNPSFSGGVAYTSGGSGVSLSDQFSRVEDPPYQRGGQPITRDFNLAVLGVSLTPGGGRLALNLRYTNMLDAFEGSEFRFGNRMAHDGLIDLSWRWLPKTALFLQTGVGYSQYLSDQAEAAGKSNSIPWRVLGGLRGLITPKLVMLVSLGYSDAIYENEAINPSGASNIAASVATTFNATEWTSLAASYAHEFRDSPILGSYYDLDGVEVGVGQRVADFTLTLAGRYEYRRFHGVQGAEMLPITRKDHVYYVRLTGDYMLQKWFYMGFSYLTMINRSSEAASAASAMTGPLDYGKHVILGRIGVSY
jgi:hypothetical protein